MAGAIRGRVEGDKYRLSHGITLEPLLLYWYGHGLLWYVTLLVWLCSNNPEKLFPSFPRFLSEASVPRLVDPLNSPCSVAVVVQSCSHSAIVVFIMPRLRHRMRSRRGTPQLAPSSPSSSSLSLSSEFIVGHYSHTRSGRGRFLLPNHYPEPHPPDSLSSPSFGSAIFTLNFSLNRPRISTHISVIFYEEAQDVREYSSHQEGPASISAPNPFSVQAPEVPTHNALDMVMAPAAPGPFETDAAPSPYETDAAPTRDLPDFDWCKILEEPPDV